MDQAIPRDRLGWARLSAAELSIVRGFAWTAQWRSTRSLAIGLSWLGNGWAYLVIAAGAVLAFGWRALPVIAIGALNAGLLHCLYPSIKRVVARPRPYRCDGTLVPLLRALDEHSFPSGHAMTLSAALVPLVLAFPALLTVAVVMAGLMAWARLASAHHYPSDVAAGTMLGVSVSLPVSFYALVAARLVV
ncbi:MAG TPA: phosphatase PAP2 family protein [Acetobacteraceae bacterium]|jgi:undecaprenyl-diphosphatase|nr:phosphatase PAP2 family protein [Acetobacteraceae bacterium]